MPEINPYALNIDENTYYPSGNITIFPSSNAVDSGKLMMEYHGRRITINITDLNYVVSPNPGGYDISFNDGTNKIDIQPGKAQINGFDVTTDVVVSYRLPTAEEIVHEGYYSGYALLCLHTVFDSMSNLSGNVQVGADWYCEGINILYVSYEEYNEHPEDYLLLGGVKEDGECKINKDKYTRIDAKYILVRMEGDPETGAPPTQTTDLLTFINNFLHGYWVSKAGDNEYGELLFKSEPDGYFEEAFDYKTEDPLTSTKFGVKISKTGSTIVLKPENEASSNMVNQMIPGIIGFYKGTYKGDKNSVFDESIKASGAELPTSTYNKTNLLQLLVDSGAIRAKQSNNGPVLSIETNKASHNNVEQGNVIYANNTGSNIADSDVSTSYSGKISYLVDANNRIKNVSTSNTLRYVLLDAVKSNFDGPVVDFSLSSSLKGTIELANINQAKGSNNSAWNNVIDIHDNLKVSSKHSQDNLGNIQAEGFIVAGKVDNPASITVPDMVHGGIRPLKSGDIAVAGEGQVWSAVYNDIAEIFSISDDLVGKEITKLLLAIDENNPDICVLADKKHTSIIGIVSENPAFCCGGQGVKNGVPVALAGRVEVKYEGKKPKIGDYVGLSKKTPGYTTKCKHNSKYRCGKIVDIIDESTVKVLVLL